MGGLIVVAVLAFALVGATYRAPSESMAPTLGVGSRFTVLKFGDPEVGDVVVVNPPLGAESGDEMCGGGTPAAGQMCAKPTVKKADVKFPREITVPKNHLFLLGDNRGASDDSRFWGPVPEKWLVGKLWFVYKN